MSIFTTTRVTTTCPLLRWRSYIQYPGSTRDTWPVLVQFCTFCYILYWEPENNRKECIRSNYQAFEPVILIPNFLRQQPWFGWRQNATDSAKVSLSLSARTDVASLVFAPKPPKDSLNVLGQTILQRLRTVPYCRCTC